MAITIGQNDQVVRLQKDKTIKNGHGRYIQNEDLQKQITANGGDHRNGAFGMVYVGDMNEDIYVIVTNEKPENWDDLSAEKVKPKSKGQAKRDKANVK